MLNIDKDDADALKGKKVVVLGYSESETLFVPNNEGGGGNDNNKA
ncbi:hypothetical protein LD85_1472 [Saccharolobus islandicus L.D.8.5]|uniref:Uncharacterized protein n=2 Tax=Saccharolobus islandicus TaxID=43080 RepID=D2PK36_SACI9|nr:hypothetical protein LD85_1472 [Sulfolobus islandicus L.D.8.5]